MASIQAAVEKEAKEKEALEAKIKAMESKVGVGDTMDHVVLLTRALETRSVHTSATANGLCVCRRLCWQLDQCLMPLLPCSQGQITQAGFSYP